jgi:hypothetical protein
MRLFAIGVEFSHHVAVQRPHDANPRKHGVAATAAQHQGFDGSLTFRQG